METSGEGSRGCPGSRLLLALKQLCSRSIGVAGKAGAMRREEAGRNEGRAVSEEAGLQSFWAWVGLGFSFSAVGRFWHM